MRKCSEAVLSAGRIRYNHTRANQAEQSARPPPRMFCRSSFPVSTPDTIPPPYHARPTVARNDRGPPHRAHAAEKIRRQKSQDAGRACDVSALPAQAADAIRAHDLARAAVHPVPESGTAGAGLPDLIQEDEITAENLPPPRITRTPAPATAYTRTTAPGRGSGYPSPGSIKFSMLYALCPASPKT